MPWKAGTYFYLLTSLSSQHTNALRSCHLGNIIEYDTVTNLSWSVDLRTHAIAQVVDKILSQPWAAAEELGREVPPIKRQDDCVVRF
jgi:putative lipase involved disintegration of autophagic bodies